MTSNLGEKRETVNYAAQRIISEDRNLFFACMSTSEYLRDFTPLYIKCNGSAHYAKENPKVLNARRPESELARKGAPGAPAILHRNSPNAQAPHHLQRKHQINTRC